MRSIFYILIVVSVFSTSLKSETNKRVGHIEILQIKDSNLLSILDSIVSHEKHCVYYTPDLYFSVCTRIMNDTITEFEIGSAGSILIESDNNYYQGCFEYKSHWFFVKGQELTETVFAKTNRKKAFVFDKPNRITSGGKIILNVIEDDRFSFWIYQYVDGMFSLKEMYDFYCK